MQILQHIIGKQFEELECLILEVVRFLKGGAPMLGQSADGKGEDKIGFELRCHFSDFGFPLFKLLFYDRVEVVLNKKDTR